MHEKQNLFDFEESGGFGDPRSWLSGDDHSSPPHSSHSSVSNGNGSSFDPVLYKNLVEVLPLLESFMEGKSKPSYTRRASLVYTKTPTKGSNSKKGREPKDKKIAPLIPAIKRKDLGDNRSNKDESLGDFSMISSKAPTVEKDREELVQLQEQVGNLQQKLLEKDELLSSTETSVGQMKLVHAEIDELKRQVAEKESLIKYAHLQLSDVNVKLADKQATLEKLQMEMTTSTRKIEELQDEMESFEEERAAFMLLFDCLAKSGCTPHVEDYYTVASDPDQLSCRDDMDDKEMKEMEEAREAYISAVAAAKENQDDELLAVAAQARLRLHALIFRTENPTSSFENSSLLSV